MKKFEPRQILSILNEIFQDYSTSGPNLDKMSSKNFQTFLNDCNIHEAIISKQSISLILASEQHKQQFIDFKCFLQCLIKVSKAIYPNLLETSDCIYHFLDRHITDLYIHLSSEIKLLEILSIQTYDVLNQVTPMITELYKSEFAWELFNDFDLPLVKKKSQEKLRSLSKTLRITPDLISHQKSLKIIKAVISNASYVNSVSLICEYIGSVFTLKHFLVYLMYCCSESGIQEEEFYEKLISFFQHIEAWLPTCATVKFSLLKAPKILNALAEAPTMEISTFKSSQVLETLETVFRIYSTWQEKTKKHTLNLNRFLKILNDANVWDKSSPKSLQKNETELVFIKITSSRPKSSKDFGKMDFAMFTQAINTISQKLFPGSSHLKQFCRQYFPALIEKSYENEVKAVILMLKDQSLVEIVMLLSEALQPYSKYYMNENSLVNFENFLRFCRDFSVFPDLIQIKKLVPIFYTQASAFAKNTMMLTGTKSLEKLLKTEDEYVEPEFLNFELFVDCIAVCALEAHTVNKTSEEKLLFAISKITQSQGANDISRKSGNTRSSVLDKQDFLMCSDTGQNKKNLTFIDHLALGR